MGASGSRRRLLSRVVEKASRLYEQEGLTTLDIAKRHGHSYGTVHRLLREAGAQLRAPRPRRRTPETIAVAAALRHQGWTLAAIGERYSVNRQTVGRWLQDAGITPRTR